MTEPSTRTVDRALALLAHVCDEPRSTLADSARAVDLSPSTALRLLRSLETRGFVRRSDDGTFSAGSRLMQLGAQALSHESLVELARPGMRKLAASTGESVYLSVEGHDATALYIAIVEGSHSVRHTNWVGRTIPLDASAAGAVLRGHTPDAGFIHAERGIEPDVTAFAAPVTASGRIIAALSILVPTYRLTPDLTQRCADDLVAASIAISALTTPEGH